MDVDTFVENFEFVGSLGKSPNLQPLRRPSPMFDERQANFYKLKALSTS